MHIFEALTQDHEKVTDLLNELIALDDDDTETRDDLVLSIRDELIPHSRTEEAVFYNSLRALDMGKSLVMHSFQEHMEAETLLRSLQVKDQLAMDWKATARKLKDAVEHHIKQEEEELFAVARKVISKKDGEILGDLFIQSKPKYEEMGFMKNTLEMMTNLLPPGFSNALRNLKAS